MVRDGNERGEGTPVHPSELMKTETNREGSSLQISSPLSELMTAYGCSSIVGYASHLPVKHVNLPLKYLKDEKTTDPGENFKSKTFSFGGFIDLSAQKGLYFSSLQYGVDNDGKTIHLIPILIDEATSLSVQFQSIQIHLPHPIIGKGMAVLQFVPLSSDEEPYIAIDLIDVSFLLINLKIELSDFLIGNLNNRLILDSFSEWVHISVPYSFELRSLPFFMQALDERNLIVSMKDGGLLHFVRLSILSTVDIYNFSESSSLIPLSFGSIFGSSKTDQVVDGISSNAVVDVKRISDLEFVTLSVSKVVKVWNIKSHKQEQSSIHLEQNTSSASWLTTIPTKYLEVIAYGQNSYLTVSYTVEDNDQSTNGYNFKSFEISSEGSIKTPYVHEFTPDMHLPSSTADSSAFKIQDFQICNSDQPNILNYFVLWKSSTYSILIRYDLNTETSAVTSYSSSLTTHGTLPEELILRQDDSYYQNFIFNSGYYDDEIVSTALSIFKSKSGQTARGLSGMTLIQDVNFTLVSTSKAVGVSTTSLWYKLYLICEEFRKISKESLSLLVTPKFIYTCEVNGVGVYGKAHAFQSFGQTSANDGISKLLFALSSKFSITTRRRLLEEIRHLTEVTPSDASRLASDYLSSKITESDVSQLMDEMAKIPNVVEVINELISGDMKDEIILDELSAVRSGEGYGVFSKLLTASVFKSIKESHESTLLNLFILFLLCEVNDTISRFLSEIVKKFSTYALFEDLFDVSFSGSGSKSGLEDKKVSSLENSIFWSSVVSKYPVLLSLIKGKDYNSAFDYFSLNILGKHHDEVLLNVVLDLLNRNEAKMVEEKFHQTFEINSPLTRFLSGLLYLSNNKPSQFFAIMSDYETFKSIDNKELKDILIKGLSSNPELKSFLSSIFAKSSHEALTHANYFHGLAQLSRTFSRKRDSISSSEDSSLSKTFLKESLEFDKKAVSILEEVKEQNSSITGLKTLLLRSLFEDSLDSYQLSDAVGSLEKLSSLISRSDLKSYFTRLMKLLIIHHEISRCFIRGENRLFVENYLLVDSILLELANNDLILSNALRYYEFLYSWRLFGSSIDASPHNLGDKRGAVESLYIFITRFKLEQDNLGLSSNESDDFNQFKLKVLELYMIIINCLKTFEDAEERWFVKRDTERRLGVIKLNEVTVEYYKWLKELESDLGDGI